jgi:hypothetical protein
MLVQLFVKHSLVIIEQYLNDYEAMLNEELDKHFSENDDEGEPLDD